MRIKKASLKREAFFLCMMLLQFFINERCCAGLRRGKSSFWSASIEVISRIKNIDQYVFFIILLPKIKQERVTI